MEQPNGMFARVYKDRSLRLHYFLRGDGPKKIMLIMGFLTDSGVWKHQYEFFEKKMGYQVCCFDNRGMNGSGAPLGFYSTSMMAEDALGLADYLGWECFHVIGLSMGGMIATELALKAPTRVISLALLATHAGDWWHSRPPAVGLIRLIGNAFLPPFLPILQRRATINTLKTLYGPKNLKEKWDELYEFHYPRIIHRWKTTPPQGFIGQGMAVLTHHVREGLILKLKYSGIPIVLLVGTEDVLVFTENTHSFARKLGCRPYILPDAGHNFVVDEKEAVNKILFDHIEAVENRIDSSGGLEEYVKHRKRAAFVDVLDLTCTHRQFCAVWILRGFFSGVFSTTCYRLLWILIVRLYRHLVKKEELKLREAFTPAAFFDAIEGSILSGYLRAVARSASCIWNSYRAWKKHEAQQEKLPISERPIFPPFSPFYLGIGFALLAYRSRG